LFVKPVKSDTVTLVLVWRQKKITFKIKQLKPERQLITFGQLLGRFFKLKALHSLSLVRVLKKDSDANTIKLKLQ